MNNYNPIAAIKQLKKHLYVYHCKVIVRTNSKFNKMREQSRQDSKRIARIIVKELQEYKRQFPELYKLYRLEVK